jgi:hypothetical protein
MALSCSDTCDLLMEKLLAAGFKIDINWQGQEKLYEALKSCTILPPVAQDHLGISLRSILVNLALAKKQGFESGYLVLAKEAAEAALASTILAPSPGSPPGSTKEAKEIVRLWLRDNNFPALKLSAKTVDFSDLARGSRVFVTVHGWKSNKGWGKLRLTARANGFCVESD